MSRELARLGTSALEQAQIAQEIRAGGAFVPIRQASVLKALPLAERLVYNNTLSDAQRVAALVADRRRQQAAAQQRLEQENRKSANERAKVVKRLVREGAAVEAARAATTALCCSK